jgi:DNA replication protein DnaC
MLDPATIPLETFVQEVSQAYLHVRGSGLTLAPLDEERIRAWYERGTPLPLALEAVARAQEAWRASGRSHRLRPLPFRRVEAALEQLLAREAGRLSPTIPSTGPLPGSYAAPQPTMSQEPFRPMSSPLKGILEELHQRLDRQGLRPVPPPPPACTNCEGRGYTIRAAGSFAQAPLCGCDRRCDRCAGQGFLVEERDGYQCSRPCPCQTLPRRVAAYNATQLPARFWNKTFDNFYVKDTDPKAVVEAKRALEGFAKGLAPGRLGYGLIGGPGRGKTHLLSATLAASSQERGADCRYVEISFLFADLKAAISDPRARATVDKVDDLAEVEILAIDEVGKGRGSVFEEEVLDELIGRRYKNEKPTLFATNYPLEDRQGDALGQSLRSRVGERIYSRLHEMVVFLDLPKRADDHRLLLRKMMR